MYSVYVVSQNFRCEKTIRITRNIASQWFQKKHDISPIPIRPITSPIVGEVEVIFFFINLSKVKCYFSKALAAQPSSTNDE